MVITFMELVRLPHSCGEFATASCWGVISIVITVVSLIGLGGIGLSLVKFFQLHHFSIFLIIFFIYYCIIGQVLIIE